MYQNVHIKREWENKDISEINREMSHSQWGAYETAQQALNTDITKSGNIKSLDGKWKFRFYEAVPGYDAHLDKKFTDEVDVPGNWELQGFGEPVYTNHTYPWQYHAKDKSVISPTDGKRAANPPYIPQENPTAIYETSFSLTETWCQKETFIQFDGVETAFYLWVNGHDVGYAEDSKLPSIFNITEYVTAGENTVTVQVMKLSTASYFEDQDYWYLSGIYRSVFLIAKPEKRIVDYKVSATEKSGSGIFCADIEVNRVDRFADCRVKTELYDGAEVVFSEVSPIQQTAEYRMTEVASANTARASGKIKNVKLWSPETPHLYTAVFTLIDENGRTIDIESCKVGFKNIDVLDGVVYLNGERLIIKGVNRHEHDAFTGRTMTKERMISEIKLMKKLNINSVRTCHYPDCRQWYELCDEYGILLVCECNLETHGVAGQLTHNPAWAAEFLKRAVRMVTTYKNHACIYSWSLGNESGTGANHAAMYGFIKEYDKDRLCQYEAGNPGSNISDVRGMMYAQQYYIMDMLTDPKDTRPIILVEFLYQILNAGGGMFRYQELVSRYKRFQGGYIWDWQDKALAVKDHNGNVFYGYGGAFDEKITEQECPLFMTNNGLLTADMTCKPVAYEAKQAYCPIIIEKPQHYQWACEKNDGKYIIKNNNMFTSSAAYEICAVILENGLALKREKLNVPEIKAGGKIDFDYNSSFEKKDNCKYSVVFEVTSKDDTLFFEKGYTLGAYQFDAGSGKRKADVIKPEDNRFDITENEDAVTVSDGTFCVVIDKHSGLIQKIEKENVNYLLCGGQGNFDRPYSGCCYINWGRYPIWKEIETLRSDCIDLAISTTSDHKGVVASTICYETESGKKIFTKTTYTVCENKIHVHTVYDIDQDLCDVPRVGAELVVPEGFEMIKYYGYGKNENYRDRKMSAIKAVFESTVEGEHFPFNPPAENGGHEETEWIVLSDGMGHALKVSADIPFHFDVHHNTVQDYKNACYEHQLARRNEIYLHIDTEHSGIGSDMGWSSDLTPENRVPAQKYILEFDITVS